MTEPIPLVQAAEVTLKVEPPFAFATTVRKPSHFPTRLELFPTERAYFVVTHVGNQAVGVNLVGSDDQYLQLGIFLTDPHAPLELPALIAEVSRRFGLLTDLRDLPSIWERDAYLRRLPYDLLGGRPSSPHSLYAFLMVCVVLQNTTVRRTVQMMDALLGRFAKTYVFPTGEVLPAIWQPDDVTGVTEQELRDLKLGYRAATIKRLSDHFATSARFGENLIQLVDDSALASALSSLYGVGPATANYVVYEWFKRVNFLVHLSPWETTILSRLLHGDSTHSRAEIIQEAHARWSPYTMQVVHAVFESVFWLRAGGDGPEWLTDLVRL